MLFQNFQDASLLSFLLRKRKDQKCKKTVRAKADDRPQHPTPTIAALRFLVGPACGLCSSSPWDEASYLIRNGCDSTRRGHSNASGRCVVSVVALPRLRGRSWLRDPGASDTVRDRRAGGGAQGCVVTMPPRGPGSTRTPTTSSGHVKRGEGKSRQRTGTDA